MEIADIEKNREWAQDMVDRFVKARKRCWDKYGNADEDERIVLNYNDEIFEGEEHRDSAILRLLYEKPWLLIELEFTIVNKEGKTVPFFLNDVQKQFLREYEKHGADKEHPYVILKGRQQGFTSLVTAIMLSYMIMRPNFYACTLADDSSKTIDLFEKKGKQVFDRVVDERFKPIKARDNLNQLSFQSPSMSSWRVKVASADAERGETISFLHCSEVATFPCLIADMQAGAIEGVIPKGTIIYESTANGYNQFKDLWDKKTNICLFFEWWRTNEYRRKDLEVLNELPDNWIRDRIEWLRSEKGLDEEQLAWYAAKYMSYVDPTKIKQEYPCTPNEAFIASGDCIFSTEQITKRMDSLQGVKDVKTGYFVYSKKAESIDRFTISDIRFVEDEHGYIRIHKPPICKVKERKGEKTELRDVWVDEAKGNEKMQIVSSRPYSLGGDTAGDGSDYFTAKVIDNITCDEVATLEIQNIDDDLYADQVYCLGLMYNEALVGIETNFSYEPTKELLRLGYPNMYVRENVTDDAGVVEKVKYGFNTNSATRPVIIADFQKKFRENPKIINDTRTLSQMMTFIRDNKGKPTAAVGEHDDLIMAEVIGQYISSTTQASHEYGEYKETEISEFDKFFGIKKEDSDEYDGIRGYVSYS